MDFLIASAMGLFTYYCVQGITKIKMQLATHFRNYYTYTILRNFITFFRIPRCFVSVYLYRFYKNGNSVLKNDITIKFTTQCVPYYRLYGVTNFKTV